jgi:histidinol-phosphatase (PHP family)
VIVDYHMHLRDLDESLAHRADAVEPYVEQARLAGVDEIGFSEHVYYFRETRALWDVPYQSERCVYALEPYVEAVLEAKRRGLPVKLGLEVDYVRGREEETRGLLEPYPWDYLLGSVHFIDGLGVDGPPRLVEEVGVGEAWRLYFAWLRDAATSGLFDALSHPDLVKIFGDRVDGFEYEEAVDAISDGDVAVEISTAGLRRPVGELYPAPELLAACRDRGVPITLASDAHVPGLVGRDFGRALALARSVGYDSVSVFEHRRRRQEPLG